MKKYLRNLLWAAAIAATFLGFGIIPALFLMVFVAFYILELNKDTLIFVIVFFLCLVALSVAIKKIDYAERIASYTYYLLLVFLALEIFSSSPKSYGKNIQK